MTKPVTIRQLRLTPPQEDVMRWLRNEPIHHYDESMGQRIPLALKRKFAAKLKAWRKREKLSQTEAAAKIGVTLDSLQNWEIGRSMPRGPGYNYVIERIA